MPVHTQSFTLATTAATEIVDVSERVRTIARASHVRNGIVLVQTRHTTSGIRIGESEPGLLQDTLDFLAQLAPPGDGYRHDRRPMDGRLNAHSHLAAILLGASEGVALLDGALQLGSWQRVFFVELDGPRPAREVVVTVVGDA